MKLRMNDAFVSGRFKGRAVKDVLNIDSSYLLWFREYKAEHGEEIFDSDVHAVLNGLITASAPSSRIKQNKIFGADGRPETPAELGKLPTRSPSAFGGPSAFAKVHTHPFQTAHTFGESGQEPIITNPSVPSSSFDAYADRASFA